MRLSQPVASEDKSDQTSNLPPIFSDEDNASGTSSASKSEPDSNDALSDNDPSNDNSILDDEEWQELPAEHYLQKAEYLNISRLRQKRYSPRTQEKLDETQEYWNQFCRGGKYDPIKHFRWLSDSEETIHFLKALFSWQYDQQRGKNSRRTAGMKYKSSLETFWKWWHLVYKAEVKHGLSKNTIIKMLAIVTKEKKLKLSRRPKATMYIKDMAEFARVLLSTTEITFMCGWLRIQLLLFYQLAAITGSRPGALLNLRYRDLILTLVRNPEGERPRLFIYLTPEFTKTFLGKKEQNTFPIPEIIFDPSLVLSPHVFLLGMLFRLRAFKTFSTDGIMVDCPENLYNLSILDGLGQQELKLKEEILDRFIFCQAVREADGIRIVVEEQLTDGALRYRMKRGGKITRFEQVTKPYGLRYGAAKAFNDNPDVTNEVQNMMLQHASINTFVKHYSVGIHINAQAIVRDLPAQKQLMRFAASMSRLIDPRRPYKLDDTSCVNEVPRVRVLQEHIRKRKQIRDKKKRAYETAKGELLQKFGSNFRRAAEELPRASHQAQKHVKACEKQSKKANQQYQQAQHEFRNEWQQQHNHLVRENLEQYKNKQPVIDSERQLSGKLVDEEIIYALEQTGYITPQHMLLIDTILTMPGSTVEKEYQRRISAINTVITFCDVEEGSPTRQPNISQKRRANNAPPSTPPPKQQEPCSVIKNKTEL